jgi:hypothetical protein
METLDLKQFNIHPDIIDDEYKHLDYISEQFNDTVTLEHWRATGHTGTIGGLLCDMRNSQPSWNDKIIHTFATVYGWKDIGTSYYKMLPGSSLPEHQDTYKKYIEIFNLQGKEQSICRSIVFLEDWQSGHYLEIDNVPHTSWTKGSVITWQYNTPHIAANLGMTPRYTLQITGHV